MKPRMLCLVLGVLCFALVLPAAAQEQGRDPEDRIEIEGHFGFYTTLAFPTTRHENPAYTSFVATFIPPEERLLHRPDLRARSLRWQGGVRASYDLTPRWAVEYGFTFAQGGNFKFNDDYINNVLPAAQAAIPTLTVVELQPAGGRLWIHSLNGVYHLREGGRWIPYLTGGVNAVSFGRGPQIALARDDPSLVPPGIFERAQFRYDERFTRLGGNVGGGVKFYFRRHFGFRGDARFLFGGSEFTQRGSVVRGSTFPIPPLTFPRFGPDVTSQQRGLYSNLHVTFGVFGRF